MVLKKCLIIEDCQEDAFLLKRSVKNFKKLDFEVLILNDSNDISSNIEDIHPHVILSDYNIPGIQGDEILTKCKSYYPLAPVIFITGYVGKETVADLISKGASDVVLKDDMDDLEEKIDRAITENSLLDPKSVSRAHELFDQLDKLTSNHNLIKSIVKKMPVALWAVDSSNKIILFIGGGLVKWGLQNDELLGVELLEMKEIIQSSSMIDGVFYCREKGSYYNESKENGITTRSEYILHDDIVAILTTII